MPKGASEGLTVRSARAYAHLQSSARNYDAERYDYLAAQLEKAGKKTPADWARRWSKEHRRVAGQLNRLGRAQ